MFLTLVRLGDACVAHIKDEREAHIGYGGTRVEPSLRLHLAHDMTYRLALVLVESELSYDELVPLYDLAGSKAHGQPRTLRMVLDEMSHCMQASMHRPTVLVGRAEILA